MAHLITALLEVIVLVLLLSGAASFLVMVKGAFVLRRIAREAPHEDGATLLKSRLVPAVSVVIAPSDASPAARALVRLMVGLHFGTHEVMLALDGPSEADLRAWNEDFRLKTSLRRVSGTLPMGKVLRVLESSDPINLLVLVLDRCGREAAMNAAINAAQCPVIGIFGPECDFPPEILLRLIPPMLEEPNSTVAVCGVAPSSLGRGMFLQFASLDFLRSWLGRQAALCDWNRLLPTPGAAILIARDQLVKAGGFGEGTLDLFLRLHKQGQASKQPYRIVFLPASTCHQRAPQSLQELRQQLARDQRGLARCLTSAALPLWLRGGVLLLRFVRPLLETAAYLLTVVGLLAGWVSQPLALLVLLSTAGLGLLLSISAVSLRELAEFQGADPSRLARLFFAAIPENLGFRQMRNLWLLLPAGKDADKQVDW